MNGLTLWMNQELSKLRKDLDVLYDKMCQDYGMPTLISGGGVPIEMRESEKEIQIKATLPNLNPEDLELSLTDDVLTIEGRSTKKTEHEQGSVERTGHFKSSMRLRCKVEVEQIKATFKEGSLEITLPKCVPPPSKRLKITS
jgi:HSP20 family protein